MPSNHDDQIEPRSTLEMLESLKKSCDALNPQDPQDHEERMSRELLHRRMSETQALLELAIEVNQRLAATAKLIAETRRESEELWAEKEKMIARHTGGRGFTFWQ